MLLGVQSLNVNNGHHWAAFCTSFGIGASNLVLFKLAPEANTTEMLAYLLGGPFGILAAMWLHPRLALWFKRRECARKFKNAAQRNGLVPKPGPWPNPPAQANLNCGADRP
jgi:hypothetical protein